MLFDILIFVFILFKMQTQRYLLMYLANIVYDFKSLFTSFSV